MNAKIKHFGKLFRHLEHSTLLALFIVSAMISVFALRHNNTTMIKLRNDVYTADKQNKDVEAALGKLRKYVYGHMNTNLASGGNSIKPPIQLKYTYARLEQAQQQQLQNSNAKVYTDAQNYCQQQNPNGFSGRGRVPCVTEYVTSHGVKVTPIPPALYQFDFVSPAWSPDLAGWSLVLSFLLFIAFIASFVLSKLAPKDRHDYQA